MFRYFLRQLRNSLLVLWGVVTLVFLLFNAMPGGHSSRPVQRIAGVPTEPARMASFAGEPLWARYGRYLNDLSPVGVTSSRRQAQPIEQVRILRLGDSSYLSVKSPWLGRSRRTQGAVSEMLRNALPVTIALLLTALLIAAIGGAGLGILAAIKKNAFCDRGAVGVSVAVFSIPAFFAAIILAYVFGSPLLKYTGLPMDGNLFAQGGGHPGPCNVILPAVALCLRPLAIIMQTTRNAMLHVMAQDYIRAAYARGLSTGRVVLRHVLPNALKALLPAAPRWLPELMAGTLFVEYVFGRSGIGNVTVEAVGNADLPVVAGATILLALLFIAINFLVGLLTRLINPQLRA